MKTPSKVLRAAYGLVLAWAGLQTNWIAPAVGLRPAYAAVAQATAATWVLTGSLNTARSGHTATLLQTGKVLVVGGSGDGSAELYDPATGTWSYTGQLSVARVSHSATLLPDGRVLVAGGYSSALDPNATAELYDPVAGTWSPTGSMKAARGEHTATLLQDGKVLVAGGSAIYASYADAELYDPATGAWSVTGGLSMPRFGHTATRLYDGRVLVAGGAYFSDGDFYTSLAGAEVYDPAAGTWSIVGALTTARVYHSATLLPSGKVLVAGGEMSGPFCCNYHALLGSELFDPVANTWSATGSLGLSRYWHAAALLSNGGVLVAGGINESSTIGGSEQFDTDSATWSDAGSLNTARYSHTATLLRDGKVLVAGGGPGSSALSSAELYVAAATAPGTIGPGYTGSWYDPTQSGHGLLVEVLSDNRFYATWFAFNPTGTQQAWFTGVGTYSGNTATITDVEQPTDGRWIPNFDSTQIVRNAWGTLTFTFTDCDHGRVDFNSVAGYGTGSMNLTRLTQPAGLTCP